MRLTLNELHCHCLLSPSAKLWLIYMFVIFLEQQWRYTEQYAISVFREYLGSLLFLVLDYHQYLSTNNGLLYFKHYEGTLTYAYLALD